METTYLYKDRSINTRRIFLTTFACLPFLGFLKPGPNKSESKKSNTFQDLKPESKKPNTSRDLYAFLKKPNTFRDLYAFLKKNDGCLKYNKENDCFVMERFHEEDNPFSCSFKGAEKDERSDGENYTQPALVSLTRPEKSFNVARGGKATKVV